MNRAMMMIKVVVLCGGLVLVVALMSQLGNKGLPTDFLSVFGMSKPVVQDHVEGERVATLLSPLNWCETRVQELELPGSIIIRQLGKNWMLVSASNTRPLDNLQMEKWLGQYCTVQVEKVPEPAGTTFLRHMTVKFIKGEPGDLLRSEGGLYKWKSQVFRSSQLDAALQNLAAQAQHTTGG